MKPLVTVLVAGLLSIAAPVQRTHAKDAVVPAPPAARENSLFILKAEKSFVGATVEIFHVSGDLLASQQLQKRKVVIDFGSVQYGTYIIRLTKGDKIQEYQYTKK
ncbi:T9SS type A sorting domain-containing protein [Dawidia soli]|uniref:T9SS type A sorting domain-containing protein n=1 Tax=Dawidia soli TaxID=2782352 RepID=A0AAP2DDI1_9BACT|nr:T9SS type A sorting domain-containing protein [Dawidia soli]MBT1689342.1 T9SS type A sorting domain-containing protein [Dawidia soli]